MEQQELNLEPCRSILERLRPNGGWPSRPVMRWNPIDPFGTVRVVEADTPRDEDEEGCGATPQDLAVIVGVPETDVWAFITTPVKDDEFRAILAPVLLLG